MQQAVPHKELMVAPTAGTGATCRSCANCPWMALNALDNLAEVFNVQDNEIVVDPDLAQKALIPLNRMLNFNKN